MIVTTCANIDEAKIIANKLLEERLIACANILPQVLSLFWWQDKIQEDNEVFLFLKTRKELEEKVMEKVKDLHSYDLPAIYCIESTKNISQPYLDWITKETNITE